jgi:hypothetical protein
MNEQDRTILEMFDSQVKELLNTKLLESDKNIKLTISGEKGEPIKTEATLFDEEQLRSFLLAFRPFYMEKEAIHFYKVANVVYRYLDTQFVKEQLAKCRKDFGKILDKPAGRLVYNNELLTPHRLIDLWFNAYYFHKDPQKVQEFKRISDGIGTLFPFFFQYSLSELTDCILWLGACVKELLRKQGA